MRFRSCHTDLRDRIRPHFAGSAGIPARQACASTLTVSLFISTLRLKLLPLRAFALMAGWDARAPGLRHLIPSCKLVSDGISTVTDGISTVTDGISAASD